jgi:superfamily II DNA or RNA helicase
MSTQTQAGAAPRYAVGSLVRARGREWVVLPDSSEDFLVLRPLGGGRDDVSGVFPELEDVSEASFPLPTPEDLGDAASAAMLRTALRVGFRASAGPFRSLAQISVEPRAYQYVPLLLALRQDTVRLLIADDVGIGKTVEAGMVAAELLAQGDAQRMAVLCSPALAEQWQHELADKFGISAELVLTSTVRRLERGLLMGESLFTRYPHVVVSTDFIKSANHRHNFLSHCPDLVIVDEAHTAVADGTSLGRNARHQRHELLQAIAADPQRHLVLVTATPHSGKEEGFRNLLALLDEDLAGLDLNDVRARARLAEHYVQRRRADIRHFLDTDTSFAEETFFPGDRESREAPYLLGQQYRELFDAVLAFAREQVRDSADGALRQRVNWWSALALLRALASSPRAAAATLRTRAATAQALDLAEADALGRASVLDTADDEALESLDVTPGADTDPDPDPGPADTADGMTARPPGTSPRRRRLLALARTAESLAKQGPAADRKLATLITEVKALLADGFDPIVFCRFIDTAEYVAEHLATALRSLAPAEREQRIRDLTATDARHVLVATDCLSEGVNLQDAFQAVIHYDLAWNPTRHEQREGRVDRFGQRSPTVRAVTIYGTDTHIDGIVLDVLIRRHQAISAATGVRVPVPDGSDSVVEALMEGLILRGQDPDQLSLDLGLNARTEDLHREWTSAAEKEKTSRTRFAHRAIHPGQVATEVMAVRAALGTHEEIEDFTRSAVTALGGTVTPTGHGFTATTATLPIGVRDALPAAHPEPLPFHRPPPPPPPPPAGPHRPARGHPGQARPGRRSGSRHGHRCPARAPRRGGPHPGGGHPNHVAAGPFPLPPGPARPARDAATGRRGRPPGGLPRLPHRPRVARRRGSPSPGRSCPRRQHPRGPGPHHGLPGDRAPAGAAARPGPTGRHPRHRTAGQPPPGPRRIRSRPARPEGHRPEARRRPGRVRVPAAGGGPAMTEFTTINLVGSLLPPTLLDRIAIADPQLPGRRPDDYHLASGETPREAANRAWTYLQGVWSSFAAVRATRPAADPLVAITRDRWLQVLLRELGYGRVATTPAGGLTAGDRSFAVSHLWERTPMHLLGWGVDLDKRTPGVAGAAERAPHALLQEYLNRSEEHLWGVVSNGRVLRLLRDSTSLSGQSFLEFDLQAMFDGEVFSDFLLLYLLLHQSRVEILTDGGAASECWLERWRTAAIESGTRAKEQLRDGVQAAITALGTGFLAHPGGADLNRRIAEGQLQLADYHQALLRLVYRLLFLFVAEDRGALHSPDADAVARDRYATYSSTARLRRLALRRQGTRHGDLWQGLCLVVDALGREEGCPQLGLPGIGGLFDPAPADLGADQPLANDALLAAVRHLSIVQPKGERRQVVDYRNLDSEELGSIYESLLELVPRHDAVQRTFTLETLAGNDRKTTGSYYTPSALIDLVLDEALDPLLDDAEKAATSPQDAADRLLALTVCDPACGSGHFLVAAARRIATRLAVARTGDLDPTPADYQAALHDVIARCIHGIDLNPMAAELAKVSLWLEALQPGRPLTFLDAHIKVGNALLGTTPALLATGIPDAAFAPLTGDDRKCAASLRKRNQAERQAAETGTDQLDMFSDNGPGLDVGTTGLRRKAQEQATAPALSLADVHLAARRHRALREDPSYLRARNTADAWCAAFVQRKVPDAVTITHDTLLAVDAGTAPEEVYAEVAALAARYRFFHWHLEFPEVFEVPGQGAGTETGWLGGFSCVVGNPPWERVKLQEKEFFASRAPEIADAANAAARKKRIAALEQEHPVLWAEWTAAQRGSEGESHLLRSSGRYPLTGRGDVNTYSVFAETMRAGIAPAGRAGIITPTGLATDATTAPFFADTLTSKRLAAFYDFENEAKIFAGVHNAFRFAVTAMTGGEPTQRAHMAFVVRHIPDVPTRRFDLAADEVLLLNPNTGTLPMFRSRLDAEITLGTYRRHPVLIRDNAADGNQWQLSFGTLFHMANDSGRFRMAEDLTDLGAIFDGWAWQRGVNRWLPLYEAKLLSHFDHRFSTYSNATQAQLNKGTLPHLTDAQHDDPSTEPLARYWVAETEVAKQFGSRWDHGWLLGWRDITGQEKWRTMVPSVLPRSAVGDSFLIAFPPNPSHGPLLHAVWSSLIFDYVARQKLSGTHMKFFVMKQLACPMPSAFDAVPAWLTASADVRVPDARSAASPDASPASAGVPNPRATSPAARSSTPSALSPSAPPPSSPIPGPSLPADQPPTSAQVGRSLREWILPRVLELSYTSHRIAGYARDILGLPDGADPGPPFRWRPERRELLRAELDAAMFHLYGLTRPEVEHVLDSFFVVRKYEERDHGEYRTRRLVLEIYDAMATAAETGIPYRTVLNPAPGEGPRHATFLNRASACSPAG